MTRDYRTNRNLFSNYYLDEYLPKTEEWDEVSDDELQEAYDEITELWNGVKDNFLNYETNESQLENQFVRPLFEKLGISYIVEESTNQTRRIPDYGFFESDKAISKAYERREEGGDFYKNAVAVADAKRWGRALDTRGKKQRDFENPSHQIDQYLRFTSTTWGVLTNGKKWRLYYRSTSHKLDSYYEVDLPPILENGDLEDFKYFYLFFRHKAFLEDASGDSFLDDVYNESNVFAQELGEDLQDNIYEAIKILSEGFIQYSDNNLSEDDLNLIHDSSLIYLYRLIFVLYAESEGRDLLDTNNEIYEESYSLNTLKQDVVEELDSPSPKYLDWRTNLWDRLDELFKLIDQGSKSQGIPKEDLYIPAYNGGLFRTDPDENDSTEAHFLANHQVGDSYLAKVIELLTRSQNDDTGGKVFVDYSSLDVRELGSIYEGLLEYQLNVADEPLALEDGEYVSAGDDGDVIVQKGEVYLTTNSGERKATGSYYTPEYVVEYIVENTLEPLVEDIRMDLVGQSARGEDRGFAAEFADRVFNLKILDPAMGSGHFLTSAVDYLAREIIDAQEKQAAQQGIETVNEEHDINWARRKVAQRCIYGVDLNPLAVELSKVSLWLRTLAAEQPLAFLDHHLKTGNSLAGSDIEEVLSQDNTHTQSGQLTLQQSFARTRQKALKHVMEQFQGLLSVDNETLEDIKEMEEVYDDVRADPLYQKLITIANVHTAERFGLDIPANAYERMAEALRDDSWDNIQDQDWFQSAQAITKEQRFFHWELEFPVAFYGKDGERKSNSGFDAVIGNPPYRSLALGSGQKSESDHYLEYLRGKYPEASEYKSNIYPMFMDLGIKIAQEMGYIGYVVPNTILTNTSFTSIREKFLDTTGLISVVDNNISVFDEVETGGVTIPIMQKGIDSTNQEVEIRILSYAGQFEPIGSIDQELILNIPDSRILTTPKKLNLFQKLPIGHKILDDIATFYQGIITGDNKKFLSDQKESKKHKKVVRGRDIQRYFVNWGGSYVLFEKDELWSNANKERFEKHPKILIRQTADELICAVDEEGVYSLDSTLLIYPDGYSTKYISALLNSRVLNWYYQTLVPEEGEAFSQVKITNLKQLPIASSNQRTIKKIESKYNELCSYRQSRESLNLNLLDYLGNYKEGPNLPDIGLFQPTSSNMLNATTNEYEKLRVGAVMVEREAGGVTISATARYKPKNDDEFDTDQWGYTETDYFEAFTLADLTARDAALVEAFVPVAVNQEIGGFIDEARKSISLLDRLKGITLPDTDDIADDLDRYIETKNRAEDLHEKIKNTDKLIDEIVYDIYELTDKEIEIVESIAEE